MPLSFTRRLNRTLGVDNSGDIVDAAHINELQVALEGITTGTQPIPLAGIEGALDQWDQGRQPETVEFHPDGSIIATPESGATITTTFLADGSIQDVYGAPINETWLTTFGADGTITREQVA